MKEQIKCVVVDFDGTLTDPARERGRFEDLYRAELARATTPEYVQHHWAEAAQVVDRNPEEHGLEVMGGHVTAPGDADPYVRCFAVTQVLNRDCQLAPSSQSLYGVSAACYAVAYNEMSGSDWSADMFRPELGDFLGALKEAGLPVWLVSNAGGEGIAQRLSCLPEVWRESLQMVSDAKKYWIAPPPQPDSLFDSLPSEQVVPGLSRRIQLKRGPYFDALKAVWRRAQVSHRETLVVGDVYDLDLALPLALGSHVHLIENAEQRSRYHPALEEVGARASSGRTLMSALASRGIG